MAGIDLTFTNLFRLTAALSPLLVGFFMIMLSVLNQNLKGIVYLAGALLAMTINIPIQNLVRSQPLNPDNQPLTCQLISPSFLSTYNSPSMSSLFLAFTFAYLLMPMRFNNQMNYGVVSVLMLLIILDGSVRVQIGCVPVSGVLLGCVLGFIFGLLWYSVLAEAGATNLLYYNEMESDAVRCSRPSKQTFKCKVYKKGSTT